MNPVRGIQPQAVTELIVEGTRESRGNSDRNRSRRPTAVRHIQTVTRTEVMHDLGETRVGISKIGQVVVMQHAEHLTGTGEAMARLEADIEPPTRRQGSEHRHRFIGSGGKDIEFDDAGPALDQIAIDSDVRRSAPVGHEHSILHQRRIRFDAAFTVDESVHLVRKRAAILYAQRTGHELDFTMVVKRSTSLDQSKIGMDQDPSIKGIDQISINPMWSGDRGGHIVRLKLAIVGEHPGRYGQGRGGGAAT